MLLCTSSKERVPMGNPIRRYGDVAIWPPVGPFCWRRFELYEDGNLIAHELYTEVQVATRDDMRQAARELAKDNGCTLARLCVRLS